MAERESSQNESNLSFRITIPSNSESIASPIPEQRVPLITDYPIEDRPYITKSQSKRKQLVQEHFTAIREERVQEEPPHNYSE